MTRARLIRQWPLIVLPALLLGCTGEKPRIIEEKCSTCHSSSFVYKEKRTMPEWDRILFGMKARGLKITPGEEKQIRDILSRGFSRE